MPSSHKNRQPSASELTGDPMISAVERLIAAQPDGQWTGQSSELLELLTGPLSETARRARGVWPSTPNGLSYRMRYIEKGLKARGILFYRPPNKTGAIHLYRSDKQAA